MQQQESKVREYHEIFIPYLDIYNLGGPIVFEKMARQKPREKNLIVIPMSFVSMLGKMKSEGSHYGAEDVLDFLTAQTTFYVDKEEGLKFFSVNDGLDIVMMDSPELASPNFADIADDLEGKIRGLSEKSIIKGVKVERPSLITADQVLRIQFQGTRYKIEEPRFLIVNKDIVNEGIIEGNDRLLSQLYEKGGQIPIETASRLLKHDPLYPNQFIRFTGKKGPIYARVNGAIQWNMDHTRIIQVESPVVQLLDEKEYSKHLRIGNHIMENIFGIVPRDMEQYLALQYGILNPNVSLMFLCGSQGSGKTLISYVAAIDQVMWYNSEFRQKRGMPQNKVGGFFKQVILLKPNDILGGTRRDLGFLPGTLYDKIKPYLAPYEDAHKESELGIFSFTDMLRHPRFDNDFGTARQKSKITDFYGLPEDTEVINMTYSGHMRGRSFRDILMLIDEAQNFTPYEIKTILSRLGEGCKCIIMGDPDQTDNPSCSREINGLTHGINHYLGSPYSCLVKLSHNYRSQMSVDADSWKTYGV